MQRREFIQQIGRVSLGAALLAGCPWFDAFAQQDATLGEKARLGIIGPGSRGQFLMSFLAKNPKVEIVAICDNYQPSIDEALKIAPRAKVYRDYRKLLEDPSVAGVVIATPPFLHAPMTLDAFAAGKHVFVEKSLSIHLDESLDMYNAYKRSGKVMFVGQQRLFSPVYIKLMEQIHSGQFGAIQAIRTNWDRNADWRRPVPSPELERKINWRLYLEYSRGLMTELACHQLQIGNWAMKAIPNRIMGSGALVSRKNGREVYDNVTVIYTYDNGVPMTFASNNSNKFYGLEEQILCSEGTAEPEHGKYYYEKIPPAPGMLRMINELERKAFDTVPFAGTSWAPETANPNTGEFITGERPKTDGTSLLLAAYAESVITGKPAPNIAEEGYYSTILSLLGHQAMEENRIITFPDKYKIDYLNHRKV